MSRFDMSGTKLILVPFSSSFWVYESDLKSNEQLCELINEKFDEIPYEGGGTDLVKPFDYLEKVYFEQITDSLVILATDGQPNDKNGVFDIIARNCDKFDLIVIGAGSIGINATNDLCFRGRNASTINPSTIKQLVEIGALSVETLNVIQEIGDRNRNSITNSNPMTHSSSECDIEYLKKLVNNNNSDALYVGAYKDYADLKRDMKLYLDIICDNNKVSKKFCVELDNLNAEYDIFVQTALHSGQFIVITNPNKNVYLITHQWQIAIENPFGSNLVDYCVIDRVESSFDNLVDLDYETVQEIKPNQINGKIKLIKTNQEELTSSICVDSWGYARIRKVLYI